MEHGSPGSAARVRVTTLSVAGALTMLVFLVHLLVPSGPVGDASFLAAVIAAAAFAWAGAQRRAPGIRLVAQLVATGLTLSALAEVIRIAYRWSGEEPAVSVADVPYFGSYLALGAALLIITLVRTRTGTRLDVDAIIDALTIVTVSVLVLWSLSIASIVSDTSIPAGTRFVWAAYPVADAVLLGLVVRALTSRRSRSLIGPPFALGVCCWLAADLGYLVLTESGSSSALLHAGWMLGALLMAASTWGPVAPAEPELRTDDATGGTGAGLVTLTIAIGPLFGPPVLDLVNDYRGGEQHAFLSPVGMAVLLVLAFVRTARLLESEGRARAEARRSHRRYARLSANSSDAVIVVGPDGRVLEDSPQLGGLVGDPAPAAGRDWVTVLGTVDAPALTEQFSRALARPEEAVYAEILVARGDGSTAWLGARMVNLLGDRDVRGVVVALADITARKHTDSQLALARDAALEASRAKSAFLATMSHEIRTPMNGVIGLTGLLLTTQLDARQRPYAQGIHRAGEALLSVINDILDFSKIEAGKLELEVIDFDLVQVVEEAAELVAEPAQAKGLELLAYCSPELPLRLRGDPSRLRQVLLNLGSNAVKFTDEGEVVVRAHLQDRTGDEVVVRFEVTDTGIGIDPADQQRLFEPFSQADSSTTRRFGGTGLGLAICRQLVTAMGGTLGLDSTPGRGTTFWFTLPLQAALDPATGPRRPAGELEGLRVLVVDDNATNRLILSEQLTVWGVHADVVPDAPTALLRLEQEAGRDAPYRLALLDMCMPGMDGLALAEQISRTPALAELGLVLLTSGPDVTAEEARTAGVHARLAKPVHLSRLQAVLQQVEATTRTGGDPTVAAPAQPVRSRGHVLVVEDNHVNQLVAVGILEHLGFTTEVAGNGVEGLASLARSRFDAVLMDCQMPEMDGYVATERIRASDGPDRDVPVIAMTAGVTEGDRERCLAAGMDDFVAKPVSPGELDATLGRWLPAAGT